MHVNFDVQEQKQKVFYRMDVEKRWFHAPQTVPRYADLIKPTLITTITFSEVETHWINHLKLYQRPFIKGYTLGPFLHGPINIWRESHHDINVLKDDIVKALNHLKAVIDSHSPDQPSSFEI